MKLADLTNHSQTNCKPIISWFSKPVIKVVQYIWFPAQVITFPRSLCVCEHVYKRWLFQYYVYLCKNNTCATGLTMNSTLLHRKYIISVIKYIWHSKQSKFLHRCIKDMALYHIYQNTCRGSPLNHFQQNPMVDLMLQYWLYHSYYHV